MRLVAAILMFALVGCAADPVKVEQVANEEADRLQNTSRPLSGFASYRIEPMTFSDAIKAEKGKMEEATEFESNFKNKVQPLLDQWSAAAADGQGTLVIKPKLVGLRIVSGGARFWAGAFAGNSFVDMNLVLENGESGEIISNVRVARNADAMSGAWSIGKSDQNLDEYVVSIVHKYLEDNY